MTRSGCSLSSQATSHVNVSSAWAFLSRSSRTGASVLGVMGCAVTDHLLRTVRRNSHPRMPRKPGSALNQCTTSTSSVGSRSSPRAAAATSCRAARSAGSTGRERGEQLLGDPSALDRTLGLVRGAEPLRAQPGEEDRAGGSSGRPRPRRAHPRGHSARRSPASHSTTPTPPAPPRVEPVPDRDRAATGTPPSSRPGFGRFAPAGPQRGDRSDVHVIGRPSVVHRSRRRCARGRRTSRITRVPVARVGFVPPQAPPGCKDLVSWGPRVTSGSPPSCPSCPPGRRSWSCGRGLLGHGTRGSSPPS